jgi:hypothetical protein
VQLFGGSVLPRSQNVCSTPLSDMSGESSDFIIWATQGTHEADARIPKTVIIIHIVASQNCIKMLSFALAKGKRRGTVSSDRKEIVSLFEADETIRGLCSTKLPE